MALQLKLRTNSFASSVLHQKLPFEYCKRLNKSPTALVMSSTIHTPPFEFGDQKKKAYYPAKKIHHQVTHSMPPEKLQIFKSLENWVENNILVLLNPVDNCWQPQDFLPNSESGEFYKQINKLRERTREIPDDLIVVFVGDMITKMAQPTYQTLINTIDGVADLSGVSLSPWSIWTRAWSAEENRHGDILNKYLYLTGRVHMKSVEQTTQYLIGSGMDAKFENNPYLAYIYFSFRERAALISYGKTAQLAENHGDKQLSQICSNIANDERRHETAYAKIVEKLFEVDPDTTILAFADMIKKRFTMPGHLMYDGKDDNIFEHYSSVAERLGVYTAKDYGEILEFFIGRWRMEKLAGLSSDGRKAQDFVCELPLELKRFDVRAHQRDKQASITVPFSWVFGKDIEI